MNEDSALVSFIIPCFNEEEALPIFLNEIENYMDQIPKFESEIILINDGSTDSTLDAMKSIQKQFNKVTILDLPEQSGKIKAQAIGVEHISLSSNICIFIDADGQHDPKYLEEMIKLIHLEQKTTFTLRLNNQRTILARTGVAVLKIISKIIGISYNSNISEFIGIPSNIIKIISTDSRFGVFPIVLLIEQKVKEKEFIKIKIRPRYKTALINKKKTRHLPIDLYKKGFFYLFSNVYEILFRVFKFTAFIFTILVVYLAIILFDSISNRNFNGVTSIIFVQLISLFVLSTIVIIMISTVLIFALSVESLTIKNRLLKSLRIYK
jgi:glycosyltransferase involved in cell wall biosynthesis